MKRLSLLSLWFFFPFWGYGETTVTPDLFLAKNNKPLFVIGAYGLPDGMNIADAKAMGFNLIHGIPHLEEALQQGLYVWSSFGSTLDFESGDIVQKKRTVQERVHAYKDHPALLFWESMDEPAWTNKNPTQARATPSGLTQGYAYLKSLDDAHPVYLNHAPRNRVETLQEYNTAADILCVDIYPIIPQGLPVTYGITPDGRHGDLPNQTPSCVGEYVDKMKAVADSEQPVFIVLQGFSWGVTVSENRQKRFLLYPTYEESRFMAMQSIVHGVSGLMYWGLHHVPKEHRFLSDLGKVLREVRDLSPILLHGETLPNPQLTYHERGATICKGIEMLTKRYRESVYLIAVNTGIDPAAADFQFPAERVSNQSALEVLNENRTLSFDNGSWFDEFDGLGVHVYRLH